MTKRVNKLLFSRLSSVSLNCKKILLQFRVPKFFNCFSIGFVFTPLLGSPLFSQTWYISCSRRQIRCYVWTQVWDFEYNNITRFDNNNLKLTILSLKSPLVIVTHYLKINSLRIQCGKTCFILRKMTFVCCFNIKIYFCSSFVTGKKSNLQISSLRGLMLEISCWLTTIAQITSLT